MKIIHLILACLPMLANAQSDSDGGVNFIQGISWEQILEKAKAENKYVFVDFYATWCGPCKAMDQQVYPITEVGEAANDRFISVKVQGDKTEQDNSAIKKWYVDADMLIRQYQITAYPTVLFFNPKGEVVERQSGYIAQDVFLKLLNAISAGEGYPAFVERYKMGDKVYPDIGKWAMKAKEFGDTSLARQMADDFATNYLNNLSDRQILTADNLRFIFSFLPVNTSDSKYFHLFYEHGAEVDTILHRPDGLSDQVVNYVIQKEIDSKLYTNDKAITQKPNWKAIFNAIDNKYHRGYADKLIPAAKLSFYRKENNWKEYSDEITLLIKKYKFISGSHFLGGQFEDAWALNGYAWDVFEHCNDRRVLKNALEWINLSLSILKTREESVQYLDTKANLLYKIGRVREAIETEEEALSIDSYIATKQNAEKGTFYEVYTAIIEKMKAGQPTWPISK